MVCLFFLHFDPLYPFLPPHAPTLALCIYELGFFSCLFVFLVFRFHMQERSILKSVAASRLRVLGPHMAKFHQGFRTIEDSMVAPGALEMLLHYSRKTAASLHPLWLGHRMSALWVQASDTALPGTPSGATGVLENVLLYLFFMNLSLLLSEENNLSQRAF